MKRSFVCQLFVICFLCSVASFAQNVTITPSGITPAMSGTYPRLSYDALVALPSPQDGDIAYDLTYHCLRVYNGSKWVCTYQSPDDPTPPITAIATIGGTGIGSGRGIGVDTSGNVYVTGIFSGTANFGATPKTSAGGHDIFIVKYNSSGTLQWVQTAGGTGPHYGYDLSLDASGNVYITGKFSGTANFGETPKTAVGGFNLYVAKYNNSGTFQWVQTTGGTGEVAGESLTTDISGNVYTTGHFIGTANFGGTSKTSVGGSDIFMVKYDTGGTIQWVQTAGGTGTDYGNGIAVGVNGNVYITGSFTGTTNFGTTPKTSAGLADMFVAKYNPVGSSWTWIQTAGGTSYDSGQDLVVDGSGNVYVAGFFSGTASFGANSRTSAGGDDIYVTKYSTGGTIQWVQIAGGTSHDAPYRIAIDASNNVYITGYFQLTATFGNTSKNAIGDEDVFTSKYSSSGVFQWVQTAGGTESDIGFEVAVDGGGNVYVTGRFSGTAKFGVTSKTSVAAEDVYIARMTQ